MIILRNTHHVLITLLFIQFLEALPDGFNYEESKVPKISLSNPLEGVSEKKEWAAKRDSLFEMMEAQMFGKAPNFNSKSLDIISDTPDKLIMDGKVIMSQPLLIFAGCKLRLLIFRPKGIDKAVPAFVGYNFNGNHTVHDEKSIKITKEWVPRKKNNKASEKDT